MTAHRTRALAMTGAIALVLLLIGWPLARLVGVLISDPAGVRAAVTGTGFGAAVAHTLETATGTTVLAVPGGALLALLTARPSLPGRRVLQAGLVLPLVVPAFVLGYSWTQAYGPAGFSDRWLGLTLPGLFGPIGIVMVGAATAVPLSYLIVMASLATRQDRDLERAARVFGAGTLTTLRTVTLPLLRAPLGAASALVFVSALEAFAVPAALGIPAGYETMTTRIYGDLALASDPASFTQAIALALGLVVLAACVVWPADRVFRPRLRPLRSTAATAATAATASSRARGGAADRLAAAVVWCYITLAVLVPLLTLLLAALTPAVGVSATPSHWTLANFRQALAGPTLRALQHSVQLALIAAVLLVLMGLLVTAVERHRHGSGLGVVVTLGYALPGSALAVGVVLAYGRYVGDTLAIILLAYLAKLWPLAHRPLAAVVDRLDPNHARAARVSGAGPFVSSLTVVLPRLSAALGGAALLVFVTVLHELTMSSLLYGPSSETLAVVVLNAQQLGDVGVTSALSVLMTALIVVLIAPALAWGAARRFAIRRRPYEQAAAHEAPTARFADVA